MQTDINGPVPECGQATRKRMGEAEGRTGQTGQPLGGSDAGIHTRLQPDAL